MRRQSIKMCKYKVTEVQYYTAQKCKSYEYLTYMDCWKKFIPILQKAYLEVLFSSKKENSFSFFSRTTPNARARTRGYAHIHKRKQKEICEDEEKYIPSSSTPTRSLCVRLPSPFSSPLLSLVL